MTFESLERLKLFVGETRLKLLVSSQAARLNGYKEIAAEHANEAQLASLILDDLANECGYPIERTESNK